MSTEQVDHMLGKTQKCKLCGETGPWGFVKHHYKIAHPDFVSKKKEAQVRIDPMVTYQNIRQQAKLMMQQIDDERNRIQKRLLELDAIAAKYKPLV